MGRVNVKIKVQNWTDIELLELMDWVVDARNRKLIGNPAHGGEWLQEDFSDVIPV